MSSIQTLEERPEQTADSITTNTPNETTMPQDPIIAVFQTPELVTRILSFLPLRKQYELRGVSKHFYRALNFAEFIGSLLRRGVDSNCHYVLTESNYYNGKYEDEVRVRGIFSNQRTARNTLIRLHKKCLEDGHGRNGEYETMNKRIVEFDVYDGFTSVFEIARINYITSVETHIEPEYSGRVSEYVDTDEFEFEDDFDHVGIQLSAWGI
ncbi:5405_t:CDS:1 [Ambispora leptoticha]|uniref:5405_t:CDS:1 n=1 Tax=Ambispora leptoticha TaxID=144679 RepID=A0A9N9FC80_9GLOM|nr:5405_t:CDS:1 [Ambispora leptoticha]